MDVPDACRVLITKARGRDRDMPLWTLVPKWARRVERVEYVQRQVESSIPGMWGLTQHRECMLSSWRCQSFCQPSRSDVKLSHSHCAFHAGFL